MRFIYISLLFLFISCTQKITNSPIDEKEARSLTENFYKDVESNNTADIYNSLDESVDKDEFKQLLIEHMKRYGAIKEKEIYEIEIEHTEESNQKTTLYEILLKISYEKGNTVESLSFVRKTDSVKLMSYYFSPPQYR